MDFLLKKVVYVGGFGGIGFASCKCLLQNGIQSLAILDLHPCCTKLGELKALNSTADIFYVKIDLTDKQNIESAFAEVFARMGYFDIVVNGAGIMNECEIERTVQINLLGVIYSTFAAMRYMDASLGGKGGHIVNVTSLVGLDVYGSYAVYTATKYGLTGFTRALSDPFYYEYTKINFINICPSTTETPMLAALRINPVTTFERKPPLPSSLCNNQTADECGKNLVEAIKIGRNGSVWILSNNQLKEHIFSKI